MDQLRALFSSRQIPWVLLSAIAVASAGDSRMLGQMLAIAFPLPSAFSAVRFV